VQVAVFLQAVGSGAEVVNLRRHLWTPVCINPGSMKALCSAANRCLVSFPGPLSTLHCERYRN